MNATLEPDRRQIAKRTASTPIADLEAAETGSLSPREPSGADLAPSRRHRKQEARSIQLRYLAGMAGLSLVDLGFTGAYVAVAGRVEAILPALMANSVILIALNILGALWLIRPVIVWLKGDQTSVRLAARARIRLRRLPLFSAIWAFCLGAVYALTIFTQGVFASSAEALEQLPASLIVGGIAWFGLAYALYFSFWAFFASSDATADMRSKFHERLGLSAGRGSIKRKLVFIALMLVILPAALILADITVFQPLRAAQGLGLAEAVTLDVVAVLTATAISLFFIIRALTRPIESLSVAVESLKAGSITPVAVLADDEIGRLAEAFNRMLAGQAERERMRETFAKYVSPHVVSSVLREGDNQGRLPGQMCSATVLFTDIQGFTGLSERITPEHMLALLNDYFELIAEPINRHGGFIANFTGDGLNALFNVDHQDPDHAASAIRAAMRIQARLERHRFAGGYKLPTRIGIHSGPVLAGSVGAPTRLGYTVYGDTVNLAARLEALNKELKTRVLISEASAGLAHVLNGTEARFVPKGETSIRGRLAPVQVFSVEPKSEKTQRAAE